MREAGDRHREEPPERRRGDPEAGRRAAAPWIASLTLAMTPGEAPEDGGVGCHKSGRQRFRPENKQGVTRKGSNRIDAPKIIAELDERRRTVQGLDNACSLPAESIWH